MTTDSSYYLIDKQEINFVGSVGSKHNSAGQWTVADLGAFYQEHRSELVSHASRLLKNEVRAEEVVQDALIRILLAAPELDSREHAIGYLHKIVENLCMDIFRLEGRRPNLVLLDDATAEVEAQWNSPDHVDVIAAADDAAIVRQALSMLSSAERAALVMWEMEGRSTKEIARELGIKESAVRHTVSRARSSLRRVLTEMIVDEKRGLTALDLLSNTYRRSLDVAKKSSKAALSLILIVFAFLGFNNLTDNYPSTVTDQVQKVSQGNITEITDEPASLANTSTQQSVSNEISKKSNSTSSLNAKAAPLWFEGLDKSGIPTGFTVTDSMNSRGSLYSTSKEVVLTDNELSLSGVVKTLSGAANIFLNQTLIQDLSGVRYDALVSYGREGRWVPLVTEVTSIEIERLVSGNYLLTAILQVKSEVETSIVIPATASGRDLASAPSRVVTRLVLNPGKSQILAQAVQVIEKRAK